MEMNLTFSYIPSNNIANEQWKDVDYFWVFGFGGLAQERWNETVEWTELERWNAESNGQILLLIEGLITRVA